MIDSEAVKVTLLVTDMLDNLAVPYAISGSMASIVYGMMRMTMDVDIIADLKPEQVSPFIAALREQFYLDENSIREAVERRAAFNLIHLETMFKVDIFLPQERAFDRQQLARRVDEPVGAETARHSGSARGCHLALHPGAGAIRAGPGRRAAPLLRRPDAAGGAVAAYQCSDRGRGGAACV